MNKVEICRQSQLMDPIPSIKPYRWLGSHRSTWTLKALLTCHFQNFMTASSKNLKRAVLLWRKINSHHPKLLKLKLPKDPLKKLRKVSSTIHNFKYPWLYKTLIRKLVSPQKRCLWETRIRDQIHPPLHRVKISQKMPVWIALIKSRNCRISKSKNY